MRPTRGKPRIEPGPAVPVVVRPGAADRRDPGAARRLAGDRPALGAGRMGELRVPRCACALVVGIETVPDHHPGEMPAAWCLADPKPGEREVAGAPGTRSLIAYHHGLPGVPRQHLVDEEIPALLEQSRGLQPHILPAGSASAVSCHPPRTS